MKTTTITKVITAKMYDWLYSVKDEDLRRDLKKGLLVSGGCIASMLLGEKVNDYDVYLSDMDLVKRCAEYYANLYRDHVRVLDGREKDKLLQEYQMHASEEENDGLHVSIRTLREDQIKMLIVGGGGYATGELATEENKYVPIYFSPNAITLSNDIQIVLRFYGDHAKIHETFDFVHATNYFTMKEGLVTNALALECLLTRTLLYQGSMYPLTSVIRTKKFLKRDFKITAGEYLKMMFQISQLDLTDLDTLEEQLIGVDSAYFSLLIRILRDATKKNPDVKFTSEYINKLIDKVFNGAGDED